jgi:hypothetical protein
MTVTEAFSYAEISPRLDPHVIVMGSLREVRLSPVHFDARPVLWLGDVREARIEGVLLRRADALGRQRRRDAQQPISSGGRATRSRDRLRYSRRVG